jgi:HK97 family phage prohead protease
MKLQSNAAPNSDNVDPNDLVWTYAVVDDKPIKSNPDKRETKSFPISHLKVVEDADGIVEAITAVMGNVDLGLDVITNGAFTKTIAERGNKIRVLDNHQTSSVTNVIGKVLSLREVSRDQLPSEVIRDFPDATGGLYVRTQFAVNESEAARTAFNLIKAGYVDEWSIGYDPIIIDYEERVVDGESKRVRVLREIRLWECSAVIWGMNSATVTLAAKVNGRQKELVETPYPMGEGEAQRPVRRLGHVMRGSLHQTMTTWIDAIYREGYWSEEEYNKLIDTAEAAIDMFCAAIPEAAYEMEYYDYLSADGPGEGKTAVGKQSFPFADRSRRWNSQAAVRRCRTWVGGPDKEDISWSKYRRCFLYYDADNTEDFGAYKLPIVDVIDGSPHIIPRAVFAVAGVLQGSRGGVDIPDSDKASIKRTVGSYYSAMRSKFDDDSIVVPWDKNYTLDIGQKFFYDEAVLSEVIEQTIEAYLERTATLQNTDNGSPSMTITDDPNNPSGASSAISETTTENVEEDTENIEDTDNTNETTEAAGDGAGSDTPPTNETTNVISEETLEQVEARRQELLAEIQQHLEE